MFKISFLLLLLVIDTLYHRPNLIGYEKSRTINTKRSRAVGTRARIPHGEMHCFRMRRLALLLKAEGLSHIEVGERTGVEHHTVRNRLKLW